MTTGVSDTDNGAEIDDTWALAMLLGRPHLDLAPGDSLFEIGRHPIALDDAAMEPIEPGGPVLRGQPLAWIRRASWTISSRVSLARATKVLSQMPMLRYVSRPSVRQSRTINSRADGRSLAGSTSRTGGVSQ